MRWGCRGRMPIDIGSLPGPGCNASSPTLIAMLQSTQVLIVELNGAPTAGPDVNVDSFAPLARDRLYKHEAQASESQAAVSNDPLACASC